MTSGIGVDDAVGWFGSGWIETEGDHAVYDPRELWRNRISSDDIPLDPLSLFWRSIAGREQAVCASIVDDTAGEVGSPGLGVEEGEDSGFFGWCDETGDKGEAGD